MSKTQPSAAWITPATPPPVPGERVIGSPGQGPASAPPNSEALPYPPTGPARKRRRRRAVPQEERQPTPPTLHIQRWQDPLVRDCLPSTGYYAERYYSPIIGPTCLLLLRSLCSRLETDREGFTVDTSELAASIGCSSKAGATSQFWRALRRGARFGLIRQVDDRVTVRTDLSPLPSRMIQRLPLTLRNEHHVWVQRTSAAAPSATAPTAIEEGQMVNSIEVLRLAARGLCTPEELRQLDRAHRLH